MICLSQPIFRQKENVKKVSGLVNFSHRAGPDIISIRLVLREILQNTDGVNNVCMFFIQFTMQEASIMP